MPTVKYSAHSGRAGRGCRASVHRGSSPGRQSCFSWGSGASRDGLPTPTVPPLPTSLSSEAGVGQGGQQRGFPVSLLGCQPGGHFFPLPLGWTDGMKGRRGAEG